MAEKETMDVLRCPASLDRLQELESFVQTRAESMGVSAGLHGKLALVLEELVVNVMHYAYPDGAGELELCCFLEKHRAQSRFCVRLRDWGRPFNPLTGKTPNTELAVEDRPVGGLGIFLARQMTDSIGYARDGGTNIITCCFDLSKE